MKILVSLVSGQTMPNYFGIKYYKPDKCIYLYTEESKQQMEWLRKSVGLPKDVFQINTYDYEDIQSKCRIIIDTYSEDELILNYTCGTKIMSIAAFEIFSLHRKKTFYVDSENQRILEQESGNNRMYKLSVSVSIKDYLGMYGQEIKSVDNLDKSYFELAMQISSKYYQISDLLIHIAKNKKEIIKNKIFLKKQIVMTSKGKSTQIQIIDKQFVIKDNFQKVVHFLSGGWLEYKVEDILKASNIFDDVMLNLQIDWKNKSVRDKEKFKNELDVFCTLNGSAFIFECKSGGITQDTIYKFKALKDFMAGRYAKVIIITYYDLSPEQQEKIKDFGFELVKLNKLEQFISEIKEKKTANPNL